MENVQIPNTLLHWGLNHYSTFCCDERKWSHVSMSCHVSLLQGLNLLLYTVVRPSYVINHYSISIMLCQIFPHRIKYGWKWVQHAKLNENYKCKSPFIWKKLNVKVISAMESWCTCYNYLIIAYYSHIINVTYRSIPHPHIVQSVHLSVSLLPVYRQRLKL